MTYRPILYGVLLVPHRLAAELQRHGCAFGDAEERRDLLDEDGGRLPAVKSAISPAYLRDLPAYGG